MDYEKRYRVEINKLLDCGEENIFFYWKGRVALYALLKAMGVGPGDEVIVQGYTCVVVANSYFLGFTFYENFSIQNLYKIFRNFIKFLILTHIIITLNHFVQKHRKKQRSLSVRTLMAYRATWKLLKALQRRLGRNTVILFIP